MGDEKSKVEDQKTGVRRRWPLFVGIGVVVVALAVGGVLLMNRSNKASSNGGSSMPGMTVATSSSQASSTVPPVINVTTQPGSVPGFVGAMPDVSEQTCTTGADGVTASGVVTNPAPNKQDYRIYISVMNGTQTLGVTEVDVNGVDSGAAQQWSGVVAVQTTDPQCVLRVERNDAAA